MRRFWNQKTRSRIARSALALMFAALLLVSPELSPAARAVSQSDIDALQSNADSLASEKKALQAKIDALSGDISDAMSKKRLLDQKISTIASQISNTESQIADYASLISQTEAELQDAEEQEAAQQQLFNERVRAMEERGTISYWSVLFKASSFTDLLSRLDFINEIMDSDQAVIDQLQQLQDEITAKKTSLEDSKTSAENARAQLVSQKSELDTQRSEANALVAKLENDKSTQKSAMDDLSAEEDAIQANIVELSRQLAAQQAASGQTSNAALGGYIWPVGSHKISSPFGSRSSPGGVGSTNHKGVDIAGVGYSTEVHAAKAGTVIVSQYSNSYGNYVVVSHSSGNTTLYAHMSSRKVSVGDTVAQGDTLGITGSTGHSTGPHLHFEITENGSRINPLTYLTDYIQAW